MPHAERKLITPEYARTLLEKNTKNRTLRTAVVTRYAKEMLSGNWRLTGETIKLAKDGSVLDGQHRLYACVESGVPFVAYVVDELDPEIFAYIDAGTPRRVADALHVSGEINAALLAAALGWLWRIEQGTISQRHRGSRLNNDAALSLLERHPGLREFATACNGTHALTKIGKTSIVCACYYLFSRQNRPLADEFMRKLATGVQLQADEPVYLLREKLLRDRDEFLRLPLNAVVGLFFKAWIYTKNGRRMKALQWKGENEKFPDIGPLEQCETERP
jgi:hypothetical protein